MKKLFVFILALSMVMSMGMTAFASEAPETVGQNGSKEIDVTAKYTASTDTPNVYSVDIEWSSMTFTYTQKDTKNWNAADHSYDTVSEGEWDKTSATIKVTNHSNVSVNVDVKYTAVENTGVTGALTNATAVLAAGEEGNYNGADSVTTTLTVSGTPNTTVSSEGVKVGTVKVTIS